MKTYKIGKYTWKPQILLHNLTVGLVKIAIIAVIIALLGLDPMGMGMV